MAQSVLPAQKVSFVILRLKLIRRYLYKPLKVNKPVICVYFLGRMKLISAVFLSALVVTSISAEKMRFDNHKLYNVKVENEEQANALRQLEEVSESAYSFWDSPVVGRDIDVVVPPYKLYEFGGILKNFNILHELKVDNVQKLIDAETPAIQPRAFGWTAYNNYSEIYNWLDELLEIHAPLLTNHLVGTSYEGREIRAVKLSYKPGNPTIFIEANIHAREWLTSATATWFLNELLTSTDEAIVDLAQNIDWYIIPVFNVDGFVYSHSTNRMWRKTRQLYENATICYGTDGNRNFDFQWMVNNGASQNPCSESFAGPHPFSEPETAALRDFLEPIGSQINIYLSLHTYGQYILFPYGHTTTEVTEYHELMTDVGKAAAEGFAKLNNTDYIVGTTADVLYRASGTSVDYAFDRYNIPIGFTFELRDHRGGIYGFVLPADQILPNCFETRDAIISMVERTRELGYMNVRP